MDEIEHLDADREVLGEGWWAAVMAEDECYALASRRKAQNVKGLSVEEESTAIENDWDLVNKIFTEETVVTGTVVDCNKGGLIICGSGFQGFVPISHLDDFLAVENDSNRENNLKHYVGCRLFLKVIECDQHRGRIVLSERAAQSEPGQRKRLLEVLDIGHVVSGRVTNITDFGVFVDLGGVEGLVHISELSWGRVIHPREHAEIGTDIDVQVLQVNREHCRVSLSIKRLQPNPWKEVKTKYPSGAVVTGKITEVVKYGAFAKLDDGLEGLIHISEMGVDGLVSPQEILTNGQDVLVEVVLIDPDKQRMSLRLMRQS